MDAKTHLLTLSFDDGFKRSFGQIADIYERFGLRACLNVVALGHSSDPGMAPFPLGDFDEWNRLKKRGHEVMAHSYDHADLTAIPFEDAKSLINRCADHFEAHLDGFRASESVYSFAYNASNPELEAYALSQFLAIRTQGETPVNPIPKRRGPVRIGCWSHGPENCDRFLDEAVNDFLASSGGWFVFNGHGLDDEGWGPMSADYLASLLSRLTAMKHVGVLPAGEIVQRMNV